MLGLDMDTIYEKSTCVITVSFKDETGAAVTPTQAWYSLYCETNASEILAETELTGLGTTKDIEVTPTRNAIISDSNLNEVKLLTVRFTYNAGARQGTGKYRYQVENLKKIS